MCECSLEDHVLVTGGRREISGARGCLVVAWAGDARVN